MTRTKQTLLLDKNGVLLKSCDSLFATGSLKDENMTSHFPFLESVFDGLLKRLELDGIVLFPGVETKHEFLPGYYDYAFELFCENGTWIIQWQILDATDEYNQVKKEQQSFNERSAFPRR